MDTVVLKKYTFYFLILVYISGSIGFVLNSEFFSPFTPYTLLFTCFVYLLHQSAKNSSFFVSFFVIALLGYLVEVIGVQTGFIFGAYKYGNALGIKLLQVPLIISINWAMLICSGIITVARFVTNKFLVLAIASVLVTAIDLLIEQVAPNLDFWYFDTGIAQLHNYIGWLSVAFILPFFLYNTILKGNRKVALTVLILQIIFFTTLFLFYSYGNSH